MDELQKSQFGRNAAHYATSPVHAAGESLGLLVALTEPSADWTVLDVATGAGHTALAFAPRARHVTALDITPEMLDEARKLAAARGLANMSFVSGTADQLPFADGTFDLVTCRIAPHHFPDIPAFLAECGRVLKTGGRLGIVDNVAADDISTAGYGPDELAAAAVAYNAIEKRRDPSHGRALTIGEWRSAVAWAGLTLIAERVLQKPMSFDLWCRNMSVHPAVAAELALALDHAAPALAAFLKPTISSGIRSFTLTEWLGIAVKS
ncbi:MAG: methyltransferase domain-containing protein [Hyphomicrobiaceae bacterium]|nr:methyltransferase domain-containing protein [Hyphomicrobiaceae bacterium]